MSTEIKVSFGALNTARDDVGATAGRITGQLDDLKRYLAPMVATWGGQAAAEYNDKQRQWDTAAAEMNQVLAGIGRALGEASASYLQTEMANKGRWA